MSIVKVTLTHSISRNVVPEKRYGLSQTIEKIKQNLATHFATPAEHMRLDLKNENGVTVEVDMKDEKQLGYYQCRDEFTIHVVDLQPAGTVHVNQFEDVSQVEKFEISEEAYAKRENNARAFRERMIAQQRAEMLRNGEELPKELDNDSYKEAAANMKEGDRCQCSPGDRLGTVRYVGRIGALKPGYWIGVEFDEPVGKGDGSVKGNKVFECRPMYGGFLRPDQVEVGDFPPEEF